MKKLGALIFLIVILLNVSSYVSAESINDKKVVLSINGSFLIYSSGTLPYIDYNNRILVPARIIADALGGVVRWDNVKKSLDLSSDKLHIVSALNQKMSIINGTEVQTDSAVTNKNGTIMIPLKWVANGLSASVSFHQASRVASIESGEFFKKGRLELMNNESNKASFDPEIVPVKISYEKSTDYAFNTMHVTFKNFSNNTYAKGEIQDHLIALVNNDNIFDLGSKGEVINDTSTIVSLGPIKPNMSYIYEIHIKPLDHLDPGPAQYAFLRYFKRVAF
ncbi:copper amine oxidase N-terminal domain-containing protein [Paenibacillus wynnii]|uniref:copper amine oxidase N-terminal domain-containing protein n=1 Tax=Paenibacillus wynnii TaxID=268407 RepID=UPI00278D1950|nr:copper amine oxidase N-terminal domain-containing protein [Paenibacillus wynnii]MDQ0196336.1 hypothetical protein [Paenibacillus wynnii]